MFVDKRLFVLSLCVLTSSNEPRFPYSPPSALLNTAGHATGDGCDLLPQPGSRLTPSKPQVAIVRGTEVGCHSRACTMIEQLPEELLLQIAFHLPDSADPRHLKNLCLVSRRFGPAAQETLHATAKLSISCGCHPTVNPFLKLLRTLFDRPDLASKVRTLRVRTVRKDVAKLCAAQNFSLQLLRSRSLAKLAELGYKKSHPWHRTIQNSIESGFAGLLLIMLPNLTHLDFWVKDHHRGPPSSECISGLFGGMLAPDRVITGWNNLQHLTTSDTHVLKSGIQFESLTSLDLKTVSMGTILRLNGPGSLQGTTNLHVLALTASIQFMDELLIDKTEVELADLFKALGCSRLRKLEIMLYVCAHCLCDVS